MIADKDLISIQNARILAENAVEAQKKLATFTQEQLDQIVECMAGEIERHAESLAKLSYEESDFGNWQDKLFKNRFACTNVREQLRGMRCVGVIAEDKQQKMLDVGVPVGVIAALCPLTSPVSTTIYKALIAIKSGNAIIFSPHPRAVKCIGTALDIMIKAAKNAGLPEGCISYMNTVTKSGTLELMGHSATSLVLMTGVPGMFRAAQCVGKPIIYGGTGNGPAFIERTANINQAVKDIIQSKIFDHGIVSSAEQSVVVDECVNHQVKAAFQANGAYFMTEEESFKLAELFFYADGRRKKDMVGKSALRLARQAGFSVPENTVVLVAEREYVSDKDPYSKELLSPVLAYYVEDDWMHACEKCIELLITEKNAHTLVIHSQDEDVIRQFALRKPVGRLLVNTPATYGSMGVTTNLFPSMTLGSGTTGFGITADNVSPLNLIYTRKIGYGVREMKCIDRKEGDVQTVSSFVNNSPKNSEQIQAFQQILIKAISALD